MHNPIGHSLFSVITKTWVGRPVLSWELILNSASPTTTRAGLSVSSHLLTGEYPTGDKITPAQISLLILTMNQHLPSWNYSVAPIPN